MAKRPTIIDVAKIAGVSKSTVSLVLQNSPSVKRQTRDKIHAAIRETGYVYNRGAANLRGAPAGLMGLVINNLRNPFYAELAVSTQMTFSERGYATVVANSNEDPKIQDEVIGSMLEHGVDALLIAPCYGGDGLGFDRIIRAGIPAIQVLRKADDRTEELPFCSMDYERGSHLAAAHLADQGTRNIAFVGGVEAYAITSERKSGYLAKMEELGRKPLLFHGASSRAFGCATALSLVNDHPEIDGVMAFNDLVAMGMAAGFAEAGVTLGRDIRLVGFDDIEEAAQCYPSLTTIRCDVNSFGCWTAGLLVNWLEKGEHPGAPSRIPVELVVRATG